LLTRYACCGTHSAQELFFVNHCRTEVDDCQMNVANKVVEIGVLAVDDLLALSLQCISQNTTN